MVPSWLEIVGRRRRESSTRKDSAIRLSIPGTPETNGGQSPVARGNGTLLIFVRGLRIGRPDWAAPGETLSTDQHPPSLKRRKPCIEVIASKRYPDRTNGRFLAPEDAEVLEERFHPSILEVNPGS